MFGFLKTKKGFTLFEICVTVVILAVLTAIAIPIYKSSADRQKQDDCLNQVTFMQADVQMIMMGMEDNGKRIFSMTMTNKDGVDTFGDYWVIDATGPTMLEMRNGVESGGGAFHKSLDYKKPGDDVKLSVRTLVSFFDYSELPVCAFSSEETPYQYRLYADGKIRCTCPECGFPES